jgi:4-hydroxybenzoate polyprenyltransferase
VIGIANIKRTLLFGNIFVAACAYFQSLEVLYFHRKLNFINSSSLFVFFSTLLIYNYRKLLFAKKDLQAPYTQRATWVFANQGLLAIICFSALLGILISTFNLSFKTLLFLFPLFLISVLYATPFSRNLDSVKKLRQLPFVKIFLVSGVWSAVTVMFPVFENDFQNLFSEEVLFTFCARFVFIFAITLPFDIRDMELDRKNEIKTFPVVFGEKRSVHLSMLACILFILMQLYAIYFLQFDNPALNWGYILSGIVALLFVSQASTKRNEYFVAFWIEALMLVQFILLFATNYWATK